MNMQAPATEIALQSHTRSILLALAGFFLWSCGDAAIRALGDLPLAVVVFGYSFSALVVMSVFSKQLGGFRETLRRPKLKLRVARGVLLVGSNTLACVAFTTLDMATAYALIFLSPFMAKMVAFMLLGERPSRISLILSAVAFAGVLVILRPGMVPLSIGSVAAVGLTLFFALGYTLGRVIGEDNQTPLSMILFQYSMLPVLSLPFAAPHLMSLSLSPLQIGLIVLSGCTAVFGTIASSTAFTRAPASVVAPLHYSQMLWGLLFGVVFFREVPDLITIIGAGIIIGAGLALIKFSRRKVKPV